MHHCFHSLLQNFLVQPSSHSWILTLHGLPCWCHCSVLTRNALWDIRICPPRATSAIALHLVSTSPLYSLQPLVGFICKRENVMIGLAQLDGDWQFRQHNSQKSVEVHNEQGSRGKLATA